MKEENLFENAVEAGETNSFFKGEGRYFVRDPDWGEHVYTAHYGSWVDRYTNSSSENASKFCESFSGPKYCHSYNIKLYVSLGCFR